MGVDYAVGGLPFDGGLFEFASADGVDLGDLDGPVIASLCLYCVCFRRHQLCRRHFIFFAADSADLEEMMGKARGACTSCRFGDREVLMSE